MSASEAASSRRYWPKLARSDYASRNTNNVLSETLVSGPYEGLVACERRLTGLLGRLARSHGATLASSHRGYSNPTVRQSRL